MTIPDLVQQIRAYFATAMAEGFTAAEAMQLAQHYQQTMMQNDLVERLQTRGDKPWER